MNRVKINIPQPVQQGLSDLGRLVALYRKHKKWRQQDLATRLGVTRQTVARLEKGNASISIGIYYTALWLLDATELSPTSQPLINLASDEARQRIKQKLGGKVDDNF